MKICEYCKTEKSISDFSNYSYGSCGYCKLCEAYRKDERAVNKKQIKKKPCLKCGFFIYKEPKITNKEWEKRKYCNNLCFLTNVKIYPRKERICKNCREVIPRKKYTWTQYAKKNFCSPPCSTMYFKYRKMGIWYLQALTMERYLEAYLDKNLSALKTLVFLLYSATIWQNRISKKKLN